MRPRKFRRVAIAEVVTQSCAIGSACPNQTLNARHYTPTAMLQASPDAAFNCSRIQLCRGRGLRLGTVALFAGGQSGNSDTRHFGGHNRIRSRDGNCSGYRTPTGADRASPPPLLCPPFPQGGCSQSNPCSGPTSAPPPAAGRPPGNRAAIHAAARPRRSPAHVHPAPTALARSPPGSTTRRRSTSLAPLPPPSHH